MLRLILGLHHISGLDADDSDLCTQLPILLDQLLIVGPEPLIVRVHLSSILLQSCELILLIYHLIHSILKISGTVEMFDDLHVQLCLPAVMLSLLVLIVDLRIDQLILDGDELVVSPLHIKSQLTLLVGEVLTGM